MKNGEKRRSQSNYGVQKVCLANSSQKKKMIAPAKKQFVF
jgi:hypothetical protein